MGQPISKPLDEGSNSVGSPAVALHSASGYCSIGKGLVPEGMLSALSSSKEMQQLEHKHLGHVLNHVMEQLYPSCDTGQHTSCSNKQKYKSLPRNKIKPLIFC